jgi:drug/metabolite transporter (DMT)-like permease
VAIALALAAAFLFSLGTVLQQQVAANVSEAETRSAGFLVRLARRPRWLAGVAADALGFVAQSGALAAGRLVVVQPLQATTLVFSLPLGAWLNRRRIGRRQGIAALVVTAALGVFLVAANPAGGREDVTTLGWILAFALVAAACGGLLLGTLAFHERLHESAAGRAAALLALAAMTGGLVVLAMAQQAGAPPRLPRRPGAL